MGETQLLLFSDYPETPAPVKTPIPKTSPLNIQDGTLMYARRPVPEEFLRQVTQIADEHVIPSTSEKHLYQAINFAPLHHQEAWTKAASIAERFQELSLEELADAERIYEVASNAKSGPVFRWSENRWKSIHDYITTLGGVQTFRQELLSHPREVRAELDKEVKYFAPKTTSLLYIMLGGDKEVLSLDVHVKTAARSLGVNINSKYVEGVRRRSGASKGRFVAAQLPLSEYERIEEACFQRLSNTQLAQDKRFYNNTFKAAPATSLGWWAGGQKKNTPERTNDLFRPPTNRLLPEVYR